MSDEEGFGYFKNCNWFHRFEFGVMGNYGLDGQLCNNK